MDFASFVEEYQAAIHGLRRIARFSLEENDRSRATMLAVSEELLQHLTELRTGLSRAIANNEANAARTEIDTQNAKIQALEAEVAQWKHQANIANSAHQTAEDNIARLENSIAQSEDQRATMASSRQATDGIITQLRMEKAEMRDNIKTIMAFLETTREERDILSTTVETIRKERDMLTATVGENASKIRGLDEQLVQAKDSHTASQERSQHRIDSQGEEIAGLKGKVTELEQDSERLHREADEFIANATGKLDEQDTECEKVIGLLQRFSGRIAELERDVVRRRANLSTGVAAHFALRQMELEPSRRLRRKTG